MRTRDTDDQNEWTEEAISAGRSKKSMWIQAAVAAFLAIASALGGYQVTQLTVDPKARPDSFTGSDAKVMKENLEAKIQQKTEFNKARWDEIAVHLETQHKTMERLSETVRRMLERCAEVQANDNSMQRQIEVNQKRLDRVESMLFDHLGVKNGHTFKEM